MNGTAANDYQFLTRWRVPGDVSDVYAILSDPLAYPRWWPEVFLNVRPVRQTAGRTPRAVRIHSKGRLPYTLNWEARLADVRAPYGFTLEARGDFVGRGVWDLKQDGDFVEATFDWRITARKPLLRFLSFLLKPIFSANHEWAMRRGREALRCELARRAAAPHAAAG
jgi:hypothetical protein